MNEEQIRAAVERLVGLTAGEWRMYYEEEAKGLGITPDEYKALIEERFEAKAKKAREEAERERAEEAEAPAREAAAQVPPEERPELVAAAAKLVERLQIVGVDEYASEEEQSRLSELVELYERGNMIGFDRRLKEFQEKGFFKGATKPHIEATIKALAKDKQRIVIDEPTKLTTLALEHCDLWHDPTGRGYATIRRDDHAEHMKISGPRFRAWLTKTYSDACTIEVPVGDKTKVLHIRPKLKDVNDALAQLEGEALYGECKTPGVRVVKHEDAIWIDSGAEDWHGYRVTADGWERVPRLEPPFVRSEGMLPLPEPEEGDIGELEGFVHFRDDREFVLFCGTLVIPFHPVGSQRIVCITGPSGSAKTTLTEIYCSLVDPNVAAKLRPSTSRDLWHTAEERYLLPFENMSSINKELSDTFCTLCTGGGIEERKLFAQGESFRTNNIRRPLLTNSIQEIIEEQDLLDRAIGFWLDYLFSSYKSESAFWKELDAAKGRIFGALLNGLVGALRILREFEGDMDAMAEALGCGGIRFADSVAFAEAACRAMGFADGAFVEAYEENRLIPFVRAAEFDPLLNGIVSLMDGKKKWFGSPAQLLAKIEDPDDEVSGLPNAVHLSRELVKLIPTLWKLYQLQVTTGHRTWPFNNYNGIEIVNLGNLGNLGKVADLEPDEDQLLNGKDKNST
jgi:hypothetical protein